MVAKGLVDTLLDGDVTRMRAFEVRFAGMVFPGETLRTSVWRDGDALHRGHDRRRARRRPGADRRHLEVAQ